MPPVLYIPPPLPDEDQEFEALIRAIYALRSDRTFIRGLKRMTDIRQKSGRPRPRPVDSPRLQRSALALQAVRRIR